MRKSIYQIIGQCVGISLSATVAAVGALVVLHKLETPQPLKSQLPGEALLYTWRRRGIFYKVLGAADAPPLVLLHTPAIGASAHAMLPLMEPLAQTYRVYAPDLPGFGLSDKPGVQYSAAMYNQFCEDFLRDVVRQPATLVASGLSCNYAIAVAAEQPELCVALALISPIALHGELARPALIKDFVEKPLIKTILYPLLSTRLGFALTHGRSQVNQADLSDFFATTHQLGAEHAAMALLAGKLSQYAVRQFETIQQPVLMIWGTLALENQRHLACLRDTTQRRESRQVELIQGASLAVQQEQPEKVVNAIKRWQTEAQRFLAPATPEAPTIASVLQKNNDDSQAVPAKLAQKPSTSALPGNNASLPPKSEVEEITIPGVSVPAEKQMQAKQEQQIIPPKPVHLPEQATRQPEKASQSETSSSEQASKQQDQPFSAEHAAPSEGIQVLAYCVRCKKKTEMRNPTVFTMKNGRAATRGRCAICGANITRIGNLS